jgi:Apea-like HEPN
VTLEALIEPLERLLFQVWTLRDRPNDAPPVLRDLLQTIKETPSLELFNRAHQGWEEVDYIFLVTWMISRGQQVGATQVIQDINQYLSCETIEITRYLLVTGLVLNSTQFVGGFAVVPWKEIPNSDTKYHFSSRQGLAINIPDAAICSKKIIPRKHIRPWEGRCNELPEPIEAMTDLLNCATLIKGVGIQLVGLWDIPPDWAPWQVVEQSFGKNNHQQSYHFDFEESNIAPLRELFASWLALDIATKQYLRLPLERLNSSTLQHFRFVDSAIDLGIAFESTFLSRKEREQIGALIRLRAAKYLSNDFASRQAIVKQVKDVYSLRSLAVHRGTFENESAWRDINKVVNALTAGREILRQALRKHIENGVPNWELVDLG